MIELLSYLHELPPNQTLSGLNQKVSTSTESVIEVLNKLREETTTTSTTARTTELTTTPGAEITTKANTIKTLELSKDTDILTINNIERNFTQKFNISTTLKPLSFGISDEEKKSFAQIEKENLLGVSQTDKQGVEISETFTTFLPTVEDESSTETTTTAETTTTTAVTTATTTTVDHNLNSPNISNSETDSPETVVVESTVPNYPDILDNASVKEPIDLIAPLDDLINEYSPENENSSKEVLDQDNVTEKSRLSVKTEPTFLVKIPVTKSLVIEKPEEAEIIENVSNDATVLDEQTLSSISRACSNGSEEETADCAEESGLDVVLIASVTVGIVVCLAIIGVTLSVWLCKKSHHRKNVYATMEEEQPKDFTKAGPPVILQDELCETNKPRIYQRNSDKVTEL